VDQLGVQMVTSARNGRLVNLCVDARVPADNARVIEAIASGLTRVTALLDQANLPGAIYQDTGTQFTAVLRSTPASLRPGGAKPKPKPSALRPLLKPGTNPATIYELLSTQGPLTMAEIAEASGIPIGSARVAVNRLKNNYQLVKQSGGPGRPDTTYEILDRGK
jgi:ATP-dependent DNA helicase RecG